MDSKLPRSPQSISNQAFARLSVIVLTKNESLNLSRCLKSLPKSAEVIVFDSMSTDNTQQIAQESGAIFTQRKFDDYASQRNASLACANGEWILFVDADEELTSQLQKAISNIVGRTDADSVAYSIPRRIEFCGKLLRFGKSMDYPVRLLKKGRFKYVGAVHEIPNVDGPIGRIKTGFLTHHSYRDLTHYFAKFNDYTSLVARQNFNNGKRISKFRVVARFCVEFLYRQIFRLGILDGYEGILYGSLSSLYVLVKYAKLLELKNADRKQISPE